MAATTGGALNSSLMPLKIRTHNESGVERRIDHSFLFMVKSLLLEEPFFLFVFVLSLHCVCCPFLNVVDLTSKLIKDKIHLS